MCCAVVVLARSEFIEHLEKIYREIYISINGLSFIVFSIHRGVTNPLEASPMVIYGDDSLVWHVTMLFLAGSRGRRC